MKTSEQWEQARRRLRNMKSQADDLDYFKRVCEQVHYLLRLADTLIDRQSEQIKAKDLALKMGLGCEYQRAGLCPSCTLVAKQALKGE